MDFGGWTMVMCINEPLDASEDDMLKTGLHDHDHKRTIKDAPSSSSDMGPQERLRGQSLVFEAAEILATIVFARRCQHRKRSRPRPPISINMSLPSLLRPYGPCIPIKLSQSSRRPFLLACPAIELAPQGTMSAVRDSIFCIRSSPRLGVV
jgi:hypothetical protein